MPLLRDAASLASLSGRPRRLLAVFPHPDDEAYGCAGLFARYGKDPDTAVVLLTLTRGEASSMGPARGLSPAQVGDLREQRLVDVAAVVNLDGLVVADFPDSRLARTPVAEVAAAIGEVLDAFSPQVVVGHDPRGVNGHADHVAAHWCLRRALEGRDSRFAMLAYTQEACDAAQPHRLFATKEEEVDVRMVLTDEEIDRKEECLGIHEAMVTLRETSNPDLLRRPPYECFDLLGEEFDPPLEDLFGKRR